MIDGTNAGIRALSEKQARLLESRQSLIEAIEGMEAEVAEAKARLTKTDASLDEIGEVLAVLEARPKAA